MNIVKATITAMETDGVVAMATLDADGFALEVLILDHASTYSKGMEVKAVFKETEVFLFKEDAVAVPYNTLPVTVVEIVEDAILNRILCKFKEVPIELILTKNACKTIQIGKGYCIMIKPNEIMLSV